MTRQFLIDLHYCCFGLESTNDVVTLVAPIGGWMKGKTLAEIRPWLIRMKANVTECKGLCLEK